MTSHHPESFSQISIIHSSYANESEEKNESNKKCTSKFAVKFLDFFLISLACGDTPLIRFLKYYLIMAFSTTFLAQIWTLVYTDSPLFVAKTMIFIVAGITLNSMSLLLNWNRKHFLGMRCCMVENFRNDQCYPDLPPTTPAAEKFRKFFQVFLPAYVFFYSFSLIGPLLSFPYNGKKLGDIYTLMLPCRYPWEFNTYAKYMATYAFQFAAVAPLSIPVVCNNLFLAYIIVEIRTQRDILCAAIEGIKSSARNVVVEAKNGEWKSCGGLRRRRIQNRIFQQFHEYTGDRLIHCARHYQQIMKFVHHFTQCYNGVFFLSLVYSAASITLTGYTITVGDDDPADIFQYVSVLFLGLLEVFFYCFIGETLNDLYKNVRMSLYDTDWYVYSVSYRKILINFMQNTHKNVSLKASSKHTASFSLYYSILKSCYSYINVLHTATIKYK